MGIAERVVGAPGDVSAPTYTPQVLLERLCTTCLGLDGSCPACAGLGFLASRGEIKRWRATDERELSKAKRTLVKANAALTQFRLADDPQKMFEESHARLVFPTLESMLDSIERDVVLLESIIAAGEHMLSMWDRCLERLADARARRKEEQRAPEPEPIAPTPVERATCDEPGCGRDAYVSDDDGDWCKRHAHARGSLQRDAVPESDPDIADRLPEAANASPQPPGRGYRFVGGPADGRVIEVPRGLTEWEIDAVMYHKRGNAFVTRR